MTDTNVITDAIKVVTAASQQNDRWLFIAALVLLLTFAYMVIRGLVADRSEISKDARADRERYQATLVEIVREQNKLSAGLQVSMDRNTEALRINNVLLEKSNRKET